MKRVHRTKDGQDMLVSEMEDSHLVNTIKMIIKNMQAAKNIIDQELKATDSYALLNGMPDSKEARGKAKAFLKQSPQKLEMYIFELFLRGLDESKVRADLQEVMGRKDKIETNFFTQDQIDKLLS